MPKICTHEQRPEIDAGLLNETLKAQSECWQPRASVYLTLRLRLLSMHRAAFITRDVSPAVKYLSALRVS
jgi:hypothetical protein